VNQPWILGCCFWEISVCSQLAIARFPFCETLLKHECTDPGIVLVDSCKKQEHDKSKSNLGLLDFMYVSCSLYILMVYRREHFALPPPIQLLCIRHAIPMHPHAPMHLHQASESQYPKHVFAKNVKSPINSRTREIWIVTRSVKSVRVQPKMASRPNMDEKREYIYIYIYEEKCIYYLNW